jgi:hypothetical protein
LGFLFYISSYVQQIILAQADVLAMDDAHPLPESVIVFLVLPVLIVPVEYVLMTELGLIKQLAWTKHIM